MRNPQFLLCLWLLACSEKPEKIKPSLRSITQSVYASGNIVSLNQYQAYAPASGIVDQIFVSEGDSVQKGSPILSVSNQTQQLNRENARLSAEYADVKTNQGKLLEASQLVELSLNKMKNDSILLARQQHLWSQKIGSKVELEQRELAFQSAKINLFSAQEKYKELKRTLNLSALQSKNNLKLVDNIEKDFTLKSMVDGIVYSLKISTGEMVNPQFPLAVIGDSKHFILEMQVDENDITSLKNGMPVLVVLNSHKDQVFEARVSKINPLMNVQSKTFLVEAEFIQAPENLFPHVTFEANILIQTKENALLMPREYVFNDSILTRSSGEEVVVKTGIKDYQMIEILSGIAADEEFIKPTK